MYENHRIGDDEVGFMLDSPKAMINKLRLEYANAVKMGLDLDVCWIWCGECP